ncbi:hypothetical protein AB0P21_12590 [Kribbella sp. NPDC056861]|uniref:hypothetical protein n=1 Tax=Kribbella sp. NPDC056861 TaxID=3154857 RepID=UPI00341A2290
MTLRVTSQYSMQGGYYDMRKMSVGICPYAARHRLVTLRVTSQDLMRDGAHTPFAGGGAALA